MFNGNQERYLSPNEGGIVLNITTDGNVYFHFTNSAPAGCLGNVFADQIEGIVRKVVGEEVPALGIPRRTPVRELLAKYGDPEVVGNACLSNAKMGIESIL